MAFRHSSTRGFKRTSSLLRNQIRKTGESRGFAETKVLTHWEDIVGADMAAKARPVKVGYSRGGFGATLTILTTGAQAPMLEMQKEQLRAKINGVYGYNAISRIHITQTAPTGFAEGQVDFRYAPNVKPQAQARPEDIARAHDTARDVQDDSLRAALERLGQNVLSREKSKAKGFNR